MAMRNRTSLSSELLPGTLDILILKTLTRGPAHGYAIARHLERVSSDALRVGESSLYPALQRLLLNDWVKAEWGESELGRRARVYRITLAGRKRLAQEAAEFVRLTTPTARRRPRRSATAAGGSSSRAPGSRSPRPSC